MTVLFRSVMDETEEMPEEGVRLSFWLNPNYSKLSRLDTRQCHRLSAFLFKIQIRVRRASNACLGEASEGPPGMLSGYLMLPSPLPRYSWIDSDL